MNKLWLYAIGAALLVGAGFYASQERTARIEADKRLAVWKDSVKVSTARADAAEHLFDSTKAAYYALKPAVIQITKWKSKTDMLLAQIAVGKDSADTSGLLMVQELVDSITLDCAKRDSLARAAIEQATAALALKDSALTIATHPPTPPTESRIGYFVSMAYDPMNHSVPLGAGVELKLSHGHIKPYAGVAANIGPNVPNLGGSVQVGVRIEW